VPQALEVVTNQRPFSGIDIEAELPHISLGSSRVQHNAKPNNAKRIVVLSIKLSHN
jgi:hypothetical protein